MTLWVVRSGKYGENEALALDKSVAVIGWDVLPDLTPIKSRQELYSNLGEAYPEEKPKTLSNWESQIWPFAKVMSKGDIIVMPLKMRSAIAIGMVKGAYEFRPEFGDAHHTRPVEWLKEVPRSTFAQDILYSFGSFMTVCRVQRNDAEARVKAVIDGKVDPAFSASVLNRIEVLPLSDTKVPLATADDVSAPLDIAQIADDAIRTKIATVFKGHRLSNLIAAILQTQGYHTVVSPPGADGGVDIVAGRGPLGFDQPRLVVQVKSQDSAVDVTVLRELQGVMRQFSAQQGLLVAWGGVTRALKKEAERLFFEIRIWDDGEVISALQRSYEALSEEAQAELPLKRIWVLADQE